MRAMDLPLDAITAENAGARKAALVLHGLGADDRRWLLSRLPQQQRDTVQPLLDELAALGVPADAQLVEQLLGSHRTAAALSGQEPFELAQAAAVDVARIVGDESPALVATLLNVHDWPWHAQFLSLLPPTRRRLVEEALAKLKARQAAGPHGKPAALEAALVHEVAKRAGGVAQRSAPERGALSHRFAGWLRGLRGKVA